MQYVFVIDKNKKPLDPCHPARARELLRKGKATVFRRYPFTIILKDRIQEESSVHENRFKVDPGSRFSGLALVREYDHKVLWCANLEHRGMFVKVNLQKRKAVRKERRRRNTRYRPARFYNRKNNVGKLMPSLMSRVYNIETWLRRLIKYSIIGYISMELVKFDMQKMDNPEISGIEYQQGELQGYEVREYLLENWNRKCAYCKRENISLEIEHIIPKSRGGTNRISNLTLACHECNNKKGKMTAVEFGFPEIQDQAKKSLKDASIVNATRWKLLKILSNYGVSVECGSGGRTKMNRVKQNLLKDHWIDACCVGVSGENIFISNELNVLSIKSYGHGSRQMCLMNKYGFPRSKPKTVKIIHGFKTGDMVIAKVKKGKYTGTHLGRINVKLSGWFDISTSYSKFSLHWIYCKKIHMNDGYYYKNVRRLD